MASFVLSFFPLDVLGGIWDLIESVSEGFLTYSFHSKALVTKFDLEIGQCQLRVIIYLNSKELAHQMLHTTFQGNGPSGSEVAIVLGFIAGRPNAAFLFWFFGDFRCGALLFMVIHVIYKYKNR